MHLIPYTEKRWSKYYKHIISLKKSLTAIMIRYKNTKAMFRSPNGDTDFLDIVAEVLQRDILSPYLFIIYQDYILRMSIDLIKENDFTLKSHKADNILQKL